MSSKHFYRELKTLPSFEAAANGSLHSPLPDDWWVVVADVMGSTKAIEAGRYKDINTIGAATIMAVINVDRTVEIPFVFGGDGATLAIPDCMVNGVREALLGAQVMAKDAFGIDLRIGLVPSSVAIREGMWLRVGKYQNSAKIRQTSLSGFGWGWAEAVLKDSKTRGRFEVMADEHTQPNADFSGFECRWKPVNSRNGIKLAIIVQSTSSDPNDHAKLYSDLLADLKKIYGDTKDHHPLLEQSLALTLNPKRLWGEALVASKGQGWMAISKKMFGIMLASLFGSIAFATKLNLRGVAWGDYKQDVVDNADYRKFDGCLKMVIDVSEEQAEQLRRCLDAYRSQGKLVYGLHQSRQAIMTCLVFTSGLDHAHFVDGSDGGYALAAVELKRQLNELKYQKIASGF